MRQLCVVEKGWRWSWHTRSGRSGSTVLHVLAHPVYCASAEGCNKLACICSVLLLRCCCRHSPSTVQLVLAKQPIPGGSSGSQLGPRQAVNSQVGHPAIPGLLRPHVAVFPVPCWKDGGPGTCQAVPASSGVLLGYVHLLDAVCGDYASIILPYSVCTLCSRHHGCSRGSCMRQQLGMHRHSTRVGLCCVSSCVLAPVVTI